MASKEYKRAKDLPISTAAWRLLEQVVILKKKLTNEVRHDLGQDMVQGVLRIIRLIARANRAQDEQRAQVLDELLDEYYTVANLVKFVIEHEYTGNKEHSATLYAQTMPLLANVERQASGWYKQVTQALQAGTAVS